MGRYSETGTEMIWTLAEGAASTPGQSVRALVDVAPAHPANAVKAVYSLGGMAEREIRGRVVSADPAGRTQTFAIDLPQPLAGIPMLWRPVLMRSGRVMDPARAGIAADRVLPATPAAATAPAPTAPAQPRRFPFEPTYLFRVSVPVLPDRTPSGETPEGLHFYFELGKGGSVRGPALEADILGRDGDRLRMRSDGIGVVEVEATLVTQAGDIVLMFYSGLIDTGPTGYAQLKAGTGPKSAPVRFAPRYLTAAPSLQWMNRVQAFGIGEVSLERMMVEYDVYAFGPADLPF